ncbi:hypothetical protein [Arthrobacter sp. D5-1]|uniref:hypothetical protein n=1 Tax=Arthrobacter sp. D5-1 TaxID=1477518 RepID=UPI001A99FB01|nr:hypothetical protein [Arthrobacter sp. D5-1]QSZ47217.1 hypothetical protein AYX22_01500 [Arthrobacter sp. D5-1]
MAVDRFAAVRVKATGEVGRISEKSGATFFMRTHLEYNVTSVWVFFEETGEFRVYRKDSLEYLTE